MKIIYNFFRPPIDVPEITSKLDQLIQGVTKMATDIEKLAADEAALTAAVTANTDAITNVLTQDAATIADLKAQIEALKANPATLDLAALEAGITALQGNNARLAAALTPPVDPVV